MQRINALNTYNKPYRTLMPLSTTPPINHASPTVLSTRKKETMATAILIDGAFFLHRYRALMPDANQHTPDEVASMMMRWSLSHLNQNDERRDLYRIFYYDCPPLDKKVTLPITQQPYDFADTHEAQFRQGLFDELRRKRKLALRLGYLADTGQWALKSSTLRALLRQERDFDSLRDDDFAYDVRQKGVDIRIGQDIASLAYKKLADQIVLFAGDADFVPAAKLARREGIDFVLDPMWKSIPPELFEHIDGLRSTCPRPIRETPMPYL